MVYWMLFGGFKVLTLFFGMNEVSIFLNNSIGCYYCFCDSCFGLIIIPRHLQTPVDVMLFKSVFVH